MSGPRKDLVETRITVANQLRASLRIALPGAVGLFRHIDSPISLRFLEQFPPRPRGPPGGTVRPGYRRERDGAVAHHLAHNVSVLGGRGGTRQMRTTS